jgi:uncharacterized protein (TIGR03067 family)
LSSLSAACSVPRPPRTTRPRKAKTNSRDPGRLSRSSTKGKPQEQLKPTTWTFKGDKLTAVTEGAKAMEQGYKLDAAKKPKTIDLSGGLVAVEGIYTLDGDELKVCVGPLGKRPTKFKAEEDTQFLIVLKREKP